MSLFPVRLEVKAIFLPSGDQTGSRSYATWLVTLRACPPSLETTQMECSLLCLAKPQSLLMALLLEQLEVGKTKPDRLYPAENLM